MSNFCHFWQNTADRVQSIGEGWKCFVIFERRYEMINDYAVMDNEIKQLIMEIEEFSRERDWDQFHNPKDLAIALSIEASELLEAFLWKNSEDVKLEKVKEELADVLNYALMIAGKYDLDVPQIIREKIAKNAEKYPAEKAKGVATKYNEL